MNGSSHQYPSATSLARAIRRRELSVEDVVRTHLERLQTLNPVLNSVLQVAPDSAIAQARATDQALAVGTDVGPLYGVPFTVKDVYAVLGSAALITATGMVERPDQKPTTEATAVTRLRAAGAILIGVTRATLWADREQRYGPANNPYDLERTPGGSSGGEAATVAAGASPLGLGSDSGGSLRAPAHFCGIATLRPSNGRVPRGDDAAGTNDPRTVAGPLARSVEDVAAAMEVIAGVDVHDPTTLPLPWPDFRQVALRGLRVGFFTDNGIVPPSPETVAAVAASSRALADAGAVVEEALPPGLDEAWEITKQYWHYCGETGTVADYFAFLDRWDHYRIRLGLFMESFDLLLCPVEARPAGRTGEDDASPGSTYTGPFSLAGWPCAVVRAGTSPEGMPIGVQSVGAPWRDDVALAGAACIEAALGGWQPPPLDLSY